MARLEILTSRDRAASGMPTVWRWKASNAITLVTGRNVDLRVACPALPDIRAADVSRESP